MSGAQEEIRRPGDTGRAQASRPAAAAEGNTTGTGRTSTGRGMRPQAVPRGRRGITARGLDRQDLDERDDHPLARRVAALLGALAVLAQIAYPLTEGEPLRLLTIATVLLFAGASLVHAGATRGPRAALTLLVVAGGIGLTAEAIGVRTGLPFGEYGYARSLGPRLLEVPLIVPLAWLMMAYPCLLLGRRLTRAWRRSGGSRRSGRLPVTTVALTGGLALAAWDLFLDPQMVAAGHWSWAHPTPALPGVPGVPLTNYAGWVVVSLLVVAALHLTFPERPRAPEGVPGALLAWTWAGSTVGNAVFFHRPAVAVWGGAVMGLVVVPYLLAWWDDRP